MVHLNGERINKIKGDKAYIITIREVEAISIYCMYLSR